MIYDPKISDRVMLRLLDERKKAGVEVRVIGSVSGKRLGACELKRMRLHTRTIIRDRSNAFIGSQSLRQLELDARREIGLILRDASVVKQLVRTFEEDWSSSAAEQIEEQERGAQTKPKKMAKQIAKSMAKKSRLAPVAKKMAKALAAADVDLSKKVHETVREIVKNVVEETAEDAAKQTVKAVAEAG